MSAEAPPPRGVPTLTEVVQWPDTGSLREVSAFAPAKAATSNPLEAMPSEAQLTQAILADVQRQIDLMLDYRMREMLAPLLARATDGLIRDSRHALASTLQEIVARAVAQEISRHRAR